MMDNETFKAALKGVLRQIGFANEGKVLARANAVVTTLVGFSKGWGAQWWIDVGFARALPDRQPRTRVEDCDLYFRLEALFPAHRETIITAGDLDDPSQPAAYERLVALLAGEIGIGLTELSTEAGLRAAMGAGLLSGGLVRKEARDWLLS